MTKLFEQTIPELAMGGAAIVLLDEVETLAVSRHKLSFDANPVDVHRATDAVLSGMDRLTRQHRNVLLLATTNFATALDEAFLSRADHIEEFGLPNEEDSSYKVPRADWCSLIRRTGPTAECRSQFTIRKP